MTAPWTILVLLLLVLATLAALDSLVRLLLAWRSSLEPPPAERESIARWLVVIPSRHEGAHVMRTLRSVEEMAKGRGVTVLLLLDGEDADAQDAGEMFGATVVRKEPSGPTKGAALGWLAETSADELRRHEAILILDVGSTLTPSFFDHFEWKGGCDAVQAVLAGAGEGVGHAAAASERIAQSRDDRGREAMGWSARLRGTGSAMRPEAFLDITRKLRTRIEDTEASLLLIARGSRIALADPRAIVRDEKPQSIISAASQRARWLLGQYELPIKQSRAFFQAFRRSPAETAAMMLEIFGRPLSLSVPFRIAVAVAALLIMGRSTAVLCVAIFLVATAFIDVAMTVVLAPSAARDASRLVMAWFLAMLMTPRALFRWMRAKRL